MVLQLARENNIIGNSELIRKRNCNLPKGTKRKRKLSYHSNRQASTIHYNPLGLLRTIVMVTTVWYHSMSNTRGKAASRMLANAWSLPAVRTISQNPKRGRYLHSRRRAAPSSQKLSTSFRERPRTYFSETLTRTRPCNENSHRLFLSTAIVDEGSESVESASSKTTGKATNTQNDDWKESPLVNPTVTFETLLVPNSQLTKWITHPGIQHRLAKPDNWEFLKHVHPRIKLVQDYNENKEYKQLLLLPSSLSGAYTLNHTATGIASSVNGDDAGEGDGSDEWLSDVLSEESDNENERASSIRKGPSFPMSISANQLSFQYILKRLLPESALPPPSAYEQIGHVAHFNLKEVHLPFKHLIGSALLESNSGDSIQTVVNKVGQVDGKFRTYECEILANNYRVDTNDNEKEHGVNSNPSSLLETTVVEDGISIELNVAECYWCTRLSGERKELIKDIVKGRKKPKPNQIATPLVVADVFCGAGAVCMLLAKKIKDQDKSWQPDHAQQQQQQQRTAEMKQPQKEHPSLTILANDWNPKAIEYMKRSIATNGMDKEQEQSLYHKFDLSCRDSYDFLSELGEEKQKTKANPYIKKKLRVKGNKSKSTASTATKNDPLLPLMPDHVLMNFPLEAPQFLGAIRWWSWKRIEEERIRRCVVNNNNNNNNNNNSPRKKSDKKSSSSSSNWAPRFHVYTFARASSPRANDEEEMAINLVADELLPEQMIVQDNENNNNNNNNDSNNDEASSSSSSVSYRKEELDGEFGTNFSTRLVRDVAPGKVVVCVSFSVTPKLIRYMQGDYS